MHRQETRLQRQCLSRMRRLLLPRCPCPMQRKLTFYTLSIPLHFFHALLSNRVLVWKVDMEGAEIIDFHQPNPGPGPWIIVFMKTCSNYWDRPGCLERMASPPNLMIMCKNFTLRCSRRSALTVVSSVYCLFYAFMNSVPGHRAWIGASIMICTACGDRPGSTTPGSPLQRVLWLLPARFLRPILGR